MKRNDKRKLKPSDNITVNLERIKLIDGDFITMPVKDSRSVSYSSNLCNANLSEVLIELSDDDEETNNILKSSIFEETENQDPDNDLLDSESFTQFNTNARRDLMHCVGKDNMIDAKESLIHCTYMKKYDFILRFKATNVQITSLRQKKRRLTTGKCDKMIQPQSKYFYKCYIDRKSSKYIMARKEYALAAQSAVLWRSPSRKAVFPCNEYDVSEDVETSNSICKSERPDMKSYLYLNYNQISFELEPPIMTIDSIKPIFDEEHHQVKPAIENLYSLRNRGTILSKYNQDVLLFKFDIENISFEQVWLKSSTATQSVDSYTYIKYFSSICNRVTHCALPLSTYIYSDPMIKIKSNSMFRAIANKKPKWMKYQRQKRLNSYCKRTDQQDTRLIELNYRSNIQFKTDYNTFCKCRSGILKAQITEGKNHYEKMVVDYQRQELNLKRRDKEMNIMADSKHTSMEVCDYNIISNNL